MSKFFLILSFLFLLSCRQENPLKIFHLSGRTMGTTYNVKFVAPTNYQAIKLKTAIDERLLELNQILSTYIENSEINKLNRHEADMPLEISREFARVLSHALNTARKSGGSFDPTIGPFVNLWGFGPTGERKIPSEDEIERAKRFVGYKKLSIQSNLVTKQFKETYIDLSASAKGYGVDAILTLVQSYGVNNVMVEIGGEVRTNGRSLTREWKIGIEGPHPSNPGQKYVKAIDMKNFALATSGDYRNFFKKSGKKYSHTINFMTGKPVENTLASVSVISDSCMDADAWATALMAMGHEKGYKFAEEYRIKAYFIYRIGDKHLDKMTSSFKKVIAK